MAKNLPSRLEGILIAGRGGGSVLCRSTHGWTALRSSPSPQLHTKRAVHSTTALAEPSPESVQETSIPTDQESASESHSPVPAQARNEDQNTADISEVPSPPAPPPPPPPPQTSTQRSMNNWGPRRFTNVQAGPSNAGRGGVYTGGTDSRSAKNASVNQTVSRLANEALQEVQRLKRVNGFANEETRKIVWQVLGLFRDIVRDQSERQTRGKSARGDLHQAAPPSQDHAAAVRLNQTIATMAQKIKQELEALGKGAPVNDARGILNGLVNSYSQLLDSHAHYLTAVNVATMLHRTASLASASGLQSWMLRANEMYVGRLIKEAAKRRSQFDPQGCATLIWSFGKFGPQIRGLMLDNTPFDHIVEGIIETARGELSRFSVHDCMNMILGLAELGNNPQSTASFLRGLTRVLSSKADDFSAHDLSALLWAFARLKYTQCGELVDKMCGVAERKLDQFDPVTLGSFLRGLVVVDHKGTDSLLNAVIKHVEEKADDYDLQSLSKVVWALLLLSYHPGSKNLVTLGTKFVEERHRLTHQVVTATTLAFAHCGDPPKEAVDMAKMHFVMNASSYRSSDVCKLLWSLSTLHALDNKVLKAVEGIPFATVPPHYHGVEGRRQLCQMLISSRILHNQPTPTFVTRELEEACYSAWRAVQRTRTTYGLVSEVLNMLEGAGLTTCSPMLIEKVPISVNSAVDDARGLKLVIEVGIRSQTYVNRPDLQKPRQRWRQEILEALGWQVVRVHADQWNKMKRKAERVAYIKEIVEGKCGYDIDIPFEEEEYEQDMASLLESESENTASADQPNQDTVSQTEGKVEGSREQEEVKTERASEQNGVAVEQDIDAKESGVEGKGVQGQPQTLVADSEFEVLASDDGKDEEVSLLETVDSMPMEDGAVNLLDEVGGVPELKHTEMLDEMEMDLTLDAHEGRRGPKGR